MVRCNIVVVEEGRIVVVVVGSLTGLGRRCNNLLLTFSMLWYLSSVFVSVFGLSKVCGCQVEMVVGKISCVVYCKRRRGRKRSWPTVRGTYDCFYLRTCSPSPLVKAEPACHHPTAAWLLVRLSEAGLRGELSWQVKLRT